MAFLRLMCRLGLCRRAEKLPTRCRIRLSGDGCSCSLLVETLEARALPSGTWQLLAPSNPASSPTDTQFALLLSDGTLMIQPGNDSPISAWDRLTPDAKGNYVTGTWSALASMNEQRYNFASAVLPDGRVFVVGGAAFAPGSFYEHGRDLRPDQGTEWHMDERVVRPDAADQRAAPVWNNCIAVGRGSDRGVVEWRRSRWVFRRSDDLPLRPVNQYLDHNRPGQAAAGSDHGRKLGETA